jgi:transcriptional regulator with XRE-family HTH domain
MQMTIEQCRAARALLGWSTNKLAAAANLGVATVRRFETGHQVQEGSISAMRTTLDLAGVQFIEPGEVSRKAGAGVRLR